jgi:hypothetical protein
MMKKAVILLFFLTGILNAQSDITKRLGDFHEVRAYRGLNVELIKSDEPKVVITGEKADQVVIKNVNGVLKISLTLMETFSAQEVSVHLYYAEDLDNIVANEGSVIRSDDVIEQEKVSVKAVEAGMIKLELNVNYLDVKSYTGGNVHLDGKAINQSVWVHTGGIYEADDMQSDYINISGSTGGSAKVAATKLVDATANLGASIIIKGDPKEVKKKESLGGYVKY